ncbi:MAG TPA: glycosyltransferase family 9 protein [Gemmatimonadaceae bacterium]|nr:glycosyltransferase family 9 protein [Gemmatimonadaceae bacterium]
MTSPFDRICIVMLSAIGDSVHVLPVINAIKREYPMAWITWVIEPGPAALVRGHPSIDEIIEIDPHRGFGAFAAYRLALRKHEPFDLLIDLQVALKGGLVTAVTPATVKLGFDRARARDLNWLFTTSRIEPGPRSHVQDQYFEFLTALRIPAEPIAWHLGPRAEERSWQQSFFASMDRPVAALVVGAGDPDREWLPERWAEVADTLNVRYDLEPVIVGGQSPREHETAHRIQMLARYPVRNALGSGLRRLVSILDGAAMAISLDTGPLHMAVALDRPVVSLMAQADPKRTGPYRKYHDLVVDAFREPADGDAVIWTRRRGRMPRITVDQVLARVALWQERYRSS